MECQYWQDKFTDFIENTLPDEEWRSLEEHLRLCERCALDIKAFRRMVSALRSLELIEPPRDLRRRIRDAVAEEIGQAAGPLAQIRSVPSGRRRPSALTWLGLSWQSAGGLAAAAVVLVAVGLVLVRGQLGVAPGGRTDSAQSTEKAADSGLPLGGGPGPVSAEAPGEVASVGKGGMPPGGTGDTSVSAAPAPDATGRASRAGAAAGLVAPRVRPGPASGRGGLPGSGESPGGDALVPSRPAPSGPGEPPSAFARAAMGGPATPEMSAGGAFGVGAMAGASGPSGFGMSGAGFGGAAATPGMGGPGMGMRGAPGAGAVRAGPPSFSDRAHGANGAARVDEATRPLAFSAAGERGDYPASAQGGVNVRVRPPEAPKVGRRELVTITVEPTIDVRRAVLNVFPSPPLEVLGSNQAYAGPLKGQASNEFRIAVQSPVAGSQQLRVELQSEAPEVRSSISVSLPAFTKAPAAVGAPAERKAGQIRLALRSVPLREALRRVAEAGGLDVSIGADVGDQRVSADFTEGVTADSALRALARLGGCRVERSAGVYRVSRAS